jgi:hypothetical protein
MEAGSTLGSVGKQPVTQAGAWRWSRWPSPLVAGDALGKLLDVAGAWRLLATRWASSCRWPEPGDCQRDRRLEVLGDLLVLGPSDRQLLGESWVRIWGRS